MSSVDFEEAGHKLLKIKLEPGQDFSLASSSFANNHGDPDQQEEKVRSRWCVLR
jgi:hypothetical protein